MADWPSRKRRMPVMHFDPAWRLPRSATLALIVSGLGILVIAAARLLVIAGYNLQTASAILTSQGFLNALLGSVLPVIPLVMPYLALVLLLFRRFVPGVLAALAASLISPSLLSGEQAVKAAGSDWHQAVSWSSHHWWIQPIAGVAGVALVALAGLGLREFARTAGTIVALALTFYVAVQFPLQAGGFYPTLLRLPWMPAQNIALTSGSTEVGYVLADTSVSMEVLVSSSRAIVFYPNHLIASQRSCAVSPALSRQPLIRLTPAAPGAPPCDSEALAAAARPPGEPADLTAAWPGSPASAAAEPPASRVHAAAAAATRTTGTAAR
jgi:hypothetical protein